MIHFSLGNLLLRGSAVEVSAALIIMLGDMECEVQVARSVHQVFAVAGLVRVQRDAPSAFACAALEASAARHLVRRSRQPWYPLRPQ